MKNGNHSIPLQCFSVNGIAMQRQEANLLIFDQLIIAAPFTLNPQMKIEVFEVWGLQWGNNENTKEKKLTFKQFKVWGLKNTI